jgi:hypothetical protein
LGVAGAAALAWRQGGPEAEQAARRAYYGEQREKERASLARFRAWQQEVRQARLAELDRLRDVARQNGDDESKVSLPTVCHVVYSTSEAAQDGTDGVLDEATRQAYRRALAAGEAEAFRYTGGRAPVQLHPIASSASSLPGLLPDEHRLSIVDSDAVSEGPSAPCIDDTPLPMTESCPLEVISDGSHAGTRGSTAGTQTDIVPEAGTVLLPVSERRPSDPSAASESPDVVPLSDGAITPLERWTPAMDKQLKQIVPRTQFDFAKAARVLLLACQRVAAANGTEPSDFEWITPLECRQRWATLRTAASQAAAVPSTQPALPPRRPQSLQAPVAHALPSAVSVLCAVCLSDHPV